MNHQTKHQINLMAQWNPLDAPLGPLAPQMDPLGPLIRPIPWSPGTL